MDNADGIAETPDGTAPADDGTSGNLVTKIIDSRFDVPTTVAAVGDRLYPQNARFTTPPTQTTTGNAVFVPKE